MSIKYSEAAAQTAAGTGLLAIKEQMLRVLIEKVVLNRRQPRRTRGRGYLKPAAYRGVHSLKHLGLHPGQQKEDQE